MWGDEGTAVLWFDQDGDQLRDLASTDPAEWDELPWLGRREVRLPPGWPLDKAADWAVLVPQQDLASNPEIRQEWSTAGPVSLSDHSEAVAERAALVAQRVGQIERRWSRARASGAERAAAEALMRLDLLQRALRRRLLDGRRRLVLNRRDPVGAGYDFAAMDALAETLWRASDPQTVLAESASFAA